MVYKKKLTIISTIVAILVIAYAAAIIFAPERTVSRKAAFAWLNPKTVSQAEGIEITNGASILTLAGHGKDWYVLRDGNEYPSRNLRVEDFLSLLSKSASYPVRSKNSSSHEKLGVSEGTAASRIVVTGKNNAILLDLLIGQSDLTGREVFLRKAGENTVHSGENIFSGYLASKESSWINLRLFPDTENGKLGLEKVQRLIVYPPASDSPWNFTRSGRQWTVSGISLKESDNGKIDTYIRDILNSEADDFNDEVKFDSPVFNDGRIEIQLGDGKILLVKFGESDESGQRLAVVAGSRYVYSVGNWVLERIFRENSYFAKN
jgi:hypothetical protein